MSVEFDGAFIRSTIDGIEKFVEEAQRKTTLDLWNRLVNITPKDTGRAQASWIATAKKPSNEVPPPGEKTYPLNRPGSLQRTEFGNPNFVVSNIDYMTKLNDGWSDKAPIAFVEISVAGARKFAEKSLGLEAKKEKF